MERGIAQEVIDQRGVSPEQLNIDGHAGEIGCIIVGCFDHMSKTTYTQVVRYLFVFIWRQKMHIVALCAENARNASVCNMHDEALMEYREAEI